MSFNYQRRESSAIEIGQTPLGGDNPIRVQSMANVATHDVDAAVAQALRMAEAGAEYIRFTAQGEREAIALGDIRAKLSQAGCDTPLVADIHFSPSAADTAAIHVEKVRINPGNYVRTEAEISTRFGAFLKHCKEHNTAIRIGVNHGSLSSRIMEQYGDTPEGMVASCMEYLQVCRAEGFKNVVLSIKASNTVVMVQTVRLLVRRMVTEGMAYPLHLGVTEAGDGEDGRIKSAVGIGTLLAEGIGDTIRVSLSEAPEKEMPVAMKLIDYITSRQGHAPISVEASKSSHADDISTERRKSRSLRNVGNAQIPIVITRGSVITEESLRPDYTYNHTAQQDCEGEQIVDYANWQNSPGQFPLFTASELEQLSSCPAEMKWLKLSYDDLDDETISTLTNDKATVLCLYSEHVNPVGEMRAAMHRLKHRECDVPLVLWMDYSSDDIEQLQVASAADMGTMFLSGLGDGISLGFPARPIEDANSAMFGILQAVRLRISKTEYISCPGCGRTLYDLEGTIARVKAATSHLKGLKIGIMGCIVNGPGEMADADYGYVGAAAGRISLYKSKTCVAKNIPEDEAVDRLVQLIKDNGDWK